MSYLEDLTRSKPKPMVSMLGLVADKQLRDLMSINTSTNEKSTCIVLERTEQLPRLDNLHLGEGFLTWTAEVKTLAIQCERRASHKHVLLYASSWLLIWPMHSRMRAPALLGRITTRGIG